MEQKREVIATDVEQKSYSGFFFVLSGILALITLWGIWNETITRRPWKQYQRRFFKMELEKAKTEYENLIKENKVSSTKAVNYVNNPEYRKLLKEFDQAQVDLDELAQKRQFIKSDADEAYYEYKHSLHLAMEQGLSEEEAEAKVKNKKQKVQELEDKLKEFDPKIAELTKKVGELKKKKDEYEKAGGLTEEELKIAGQLDQLKKKMTEMQLKRPTLMPYQVIIRDMKPFDMIVDRCMACHLIIDKPGYEEYENPWKTHPRRDVLLVKHPVEKFGCTPCHDGQGRALSVEVAHKPKHYWDNPMLEVKGTKYVEAKCIRCHNQTLEIPEGSAITQAKMMFQDFGCFGCHKVEGLEEQWAADLTKIRKVAPTLGGIGSKVNPDWIVRWIQNPRSYLPKTRMPNFRLSEQQAKDIAAYLLASKHDHEHGATTITTAMASAGGSDAVVQLAALKSTAPTSKSPKSPKSSREEGGELIKTVGCLGCHTINGVGGSFAPDLSHIGSKVQKEHLYGWIRNPKDHNPNTPMPSFRFIDSQVESVVLYLMSLRDPNAPAPLEVSPVVDGNPDEGANLIRKYGCFGCHDIPGFENESRIAPDLTEFAKKKPEELDFGDQVHIEHSWKGWTLGKLADPRRYATERIESKMPDFYLTEEEAKTLSILLKSFNGEKMTPKYIRNLSENEIQIEKGRRAIKQYNCRGCHEIENRGGDIRAVVAINLQLEGKSEQDAQLLAPTYSPPMLTGEGAKVKPDWLFSFLKSPTPIRPWLKLRMPTFRFTDQEASRIAAHFASLSNVEFPFIEPYEVSMTKEDIAAVQKLMSKDYFDCFSCHQQGEKKPEGPEEGWAPDLMLANKRLRRDWLIKWLTDPQQLQPGTKMPTFLADSQSGPDDVLSGDEEQQKQVIAAYVLSLGSRGSGLESKSSSKIIKSSKSRGKK